MLVPFSWLKELVNLKDSPQKVAEKLLLSGTKVEGTKKVGKEIVFELEITPNRPDTLSILGVAREAAALFEKELIYPSVETILPIKTQSTAVNFKVKEKKLCPTYSIVKLGSIKVEASPEWVRDYLQLSGVRPINNVVDITNFVMLETGQPMHAFDAGKIRGQIVLRGAKLGEKITTLDNVERRLNPGAIIIEDSEKLIDLAGLMGGKNSDIDSQSSEVILLVPLYDPVTIRKTSLLTNLRTEASNRFEKKLDPNLHVFAINRAIKLFTEIAGATQDSKVISPGYPVKNRSVELELSLIKDVLGLDLEPDDVINLLSPLEFKIRNSSIKDATLEVEVPTFRTDIAIPEDLLEEIARMYGYNNFPKTLPTGRVPLQKELFQPDNEDLIRQILLQAGFNESTGYSLVSEKDLINVHQDKLTTLEVLHPTSNDFVYLRPTLLINLLKAMVVNQPEENIGFFEIAKEFHPEKDPKLGLPLQNTTLAIISNADYPTLKGTVENLVNKFGLELSEAALKNVSPWQEGVELYFGKRKLATIGSIEETVLKNFGITNKIFASTIDFEFLRNLAQVYSYQPLPRFPSVIEDISFFVPLATPANLILKEIEVIDKLISRVTIWDTFFKDNKKSITVRINFSSQEKTLTGKEVEISRKKIEKKLEQKFKAQIRKE